MRKLLVVLLLAGCSGPTLSDIEYECGYNRKPFVDSWPCVRVGIYGESSPALVAYYTALGDVVAERVRAGKMSDAEARLVMAKARRENSAAEDASRPPPAAPVMLHTPSPSITCTRFGNQVTCM
jgi:hypothetical protein